MSGDALARALDRDPGFRTVHENAMAAEIERLRAALGGIERELRRRHRIAEGTLGQCLGVDPLADIARRALEAER